MPLTKDVACAALHKAVSKNKKVRRASNSTAEVRAKADAAYDSCLSNWKKPAKRKMNPANKGCPPKSVKVKSKSGKVLATFTAHVCSRTVAANKKTAAKKQYAKFGAKRGGSYSKKAR